jgi:hypothetical protein
MSKPQASVEEKIAEWLHTQGYPLEMAVASTLRQHFVVTQSDYYLDPDTGKYRETDVVATAIRQLTQRPLRYFRITFTFECKTSEDKPWILFTGGKTPDLLDRIKERAASVGGRQILAALADDSRAQGLSIFDIDSPPAYGFTQAFTSGQDRAYESVMSAAKAAAAMVDQADRFEPFHRSYALIALPVVVLRGGLFAASLSKDGGLSVAKISEGTLLWRNPIVSRSHTIVKVVTAETLGSYAARMSNSISELFKIVESLPASPEVPSEKQTATSRRSPKGR